MLGFVFTIALLAGLLWHWRRVKIAHDKRIQKIPVRIHVNGIRGKSTVTRLIAGVLREGGFSTIAKTTGSAAMIIFEDGTEAPIERQGAPTILEQIKVIKEHASGNLDAIVLECMAVNPKYQEISQHKIVQANITVITNVREDHQDVMGDTLPQIADALSSTIPEKGTLITAEKNPELRAQLNRNAQKHHTTLIYADIDQTHDQDLEQFKYLAFKENLAIGFAVADMHGIPRDIALQGMRRALPDVGAVSVQRLFVGEKELIWAPLFAVNDRESTIISVEALKAYHNPEAVRIGILNNRYDRPVRAMKFAEIAALDLQLDYYITFGAYENQITRKMVQLGYPPSQIISLGFSKNPALSDIIKTVTSLISGTQGLLIGMVNIHTPQAEMLMEHFKTEASSEAAISPLLSQSEHLSTPAKRDRYSARHLLGR